MEPNTHSARQPADHPTGYPIGHCAGQPARPSAGGPDELAARPAAQPGDTLAALTAAVNQLAAQDLDGLADPVAAERVLALRRLLDRLEGHWLKALAAVDARGAAGAEDGLQAASTAGWLRARLRMGAGAAHGSVRTARALFRGPLTQTGQALTDGELSPSHGSVLAHGTQELPAPTAVEAEPMLLEAAGRLDPPRLRRVIRHLQLVADPEGAEATADRQHQRRGRWLAATLEGMVAVEGRLEPEAGQIVPAALEPLARPSSAADDRSGGQRRADALTELARRALEGGRLPQTGGVRPQLLVTVDLDSLLDPQGSLGGDTGWAGPLGPEACRRLACDGAVTRVLVSRHPTSLHQASGHHSHDASGHQGPDPDGHHHDDHDHPDGTSHPDGQSHPHGQGDQGLGAQLRTAMALLGMTR
jgi:hypothetical protein